MRLLWEMLVKYKIILIHLFFKVIIHREQFNYSYNERKGTGERSFFLF
jgi:hypothetical protein